MGKWRGLYGLDWLGSMQSYGVLEEDPTTSTFDFDVSDYVEHRVSVRYTDGGLRLTRARARLRAAGVTLELPGPCRIARPRLRILPTTVQRLVHRVACSMK